MAEGGVGVSNNVHQLKTYRRVKESSTIIIGLFLSNIRLLMCLFNLSPLS